jgi:hypothetical protein
MGVIRFEIPRMDLVLPVVPVGVKAVQAASPVRFRVEQAPKVFS